MARVGWRAYPPRLARGKMRRRGLLLFHRKQLLIGICASSTRLMSFLELPAAQPSGLAAHFRASGGVIPRRAEHGLHYNQHQSPSGGRNDRQTFPIA
jgi:hypothetical protein